MPAIVEVWQVGAHFKALVNGVLMAPSDLRCLFLRPKRDLQNTVDGIDIETDFFLLSLSALAQA